MTTLEDLKNPARISQDEAESIYQVMADGKTVIAWFDNPQAMVEMGVADNEYARHNLNRLYNVLRGGHHWIGMNDCERAIECLTVDGWDEGVQKGLDSFGTLDPIKLPSVRRKLRHGPVGQRLDIHRVYAGRIEEAWDVMKREGDFSSSLKKTSTTILVDIGANAGTSASEMFWRGALANTMADALSQSGRPVRIIAYAGTTGLRNDYDSDGKGDSIISACVVKDFLHPVELNNLYAQTALAASFRLLHFKVLQLMPYGETRGNLGHHWDIPQEVLEDYLGDGQDLVLNISNIWSKQSALEALEAFRKRMEDPSSFSGGE